MYYDDVLLAAVTAAAVEASTNTLVTHLRAKGLRLAERKCCFSAVSQVDWLGKTINQHEVRNSSGRSRQLAVAIRRLTLPSPRGLRRVLGWTLWYLNHIHGASRSLAPLFRRLRERSSQQLTWYELWFFALSITFANITYRSPGIPLSYFLLACDGCAELQQVGVCSFLGGITARVPDTFVAGYDKPSDAQQTCELYGAVLGLLMGGSLGTGVELLTDNSACYFWLRNQRQPATAMQSHLLLAANILMQLKQVPYVVNWIPGDRNPADGWSRAPPMRTGSGASRPPVS